jgi:hypothetical protein
MLNEYLTSLPDPQANGDSMTIGAQLENVAVEVAARWEFFRDHSDAAASRRTVAAIGRLAFTSTLVSTQILRRCLSLPNSPEEVNVSVLQERLTVDDVPSLLMILRANCAQIQLTLRLARRSDGATYNAEELAVEYIAVAEKDLTILHQLQRNARRSCATEVPAS